jgi:thiol-disulfide isomerase/thioredoxin
MTAGIFGGTFVVLAVVIIIVVSSLGGSSGGGGKVTFVPTKPAPANIVRGISQVPASEFAAAGSGGAAVGKQGSASPIVQLASSTPSLTKGGKPELVYFGAGYCPYCAATRWPLAVALSRFGSFKGLKISASSPLDVYASTRTLSFAGATYSSRYLSFNETEQTTNVCQKADIVANTQRTAGQPAWMSPADMCQNGAYTLLQTPSKAVLHLVEKYDNGTYIQTAAGSIPFIDFGGKYLEISAPYDPTVLHGVSWSGIVRSFKVPTAGIGQAVLGTANLYTAMICTMTHDKPGSVCDAKYMKTIEKTVKP